MQDEAHGPPLDPEQPPPRRRATARMPQRRATRVLAVIGLSLAFLVVFALIAFHVVTDTNWGRERVRRYLVAQLEKQASGGKVRIGRITGNLRSGITIHDLVITDKADQPFLAADSLRARYRLSALIRQRVDLDDVVIARPTIVLDRQPGGEWNWKRIFPGDTLPARKDTVPGFGDWLRFTDVTMIDGHVISRSPWSPSRSMTRAQQDSAARSVLAGRSRLRVVRVPTGYQKIAELRDIDATMPLVQLADPAVATRLISVAAMRVDAYPFRPPAAEIRNVAGTFHFTGDSLWWRGVQVRMPGSSMTGDGMYLLENGDMWLRTHARPLQHADFRWLYPRLPSRGGGPLDIDVVWKGSTQDYTIRNADMRIDRQRIQGSIAVRIDDDIVIRNSDVRVANLDTRTIEQVLGGFDIPRRGTLDGRARLRGNQTAMQVDANVAFHDAAGAGTSRVAAIGEVGYVDRGRTGILRARNLRVRLLPLRLELAQAFSPGLPVGGALTGNAVVDGSSDTGVRVNGSLVHNENGNVSRASGRATVRTAGAGTFIDADVRLDPVAMATVARFIPDAPAEGTLSGPVRFRGTLNDFTVRGDIAHRQAGVMSRVAGTASVRRGRTTFIDADVRLSPLEMSTVARFVPQAPREGTLSGPVRFRGTLTDFTVRGNVAHADAGFVSRVEGTATVRRRAETFVDANVNLQPLALGTVAGFVPDAGLRGVVRGPVQFRGTFKDFTVRGNVATADGGSISGGGRVRVAGARTVYDVDVVTRRFNASAISSKAPEMNVTGRVIAQGTGSEPATMRGTVAFNLDASSLEGARIDSAVGRVRLGDGLATVERLQVRGEGLVADAQGTFGLRRGRTGELTFSVAAPSITPFARHIPGAVAQGETPPRPGVLARRVREAREDSARIARATEVERAISGRPAPPIVVDTPRAIPRSVVGGSLFAAGTLRGNIHDFDARGRLAGENLVVRGNAARRLRGEFAWSDARSPQSRITANVQGHGLTVGGFAFDSANAQVAYAAPTGRVGVALWQNGNRDYALTGDLQIRGDRKELVARDVALRFDSTLYKAPRPFAVRWGGRGVEVDNLELVNNHGGRIFADGRLPTEGSANLNVAVTDFQVGDVLSLVQSDVGFRGLVTAEGTLRGTMASPRFEGAAAVVSASLDETPLPNVRGRFSYADRLLTSKLEAVQDTGVVVATVDAAVPMNLALSGVTGNRFPGEGLRVDVAADSLPLNLLQVTDLVSDVTGRAAGRISMRGSLKRPQLVGAVAITNAAAKIEPLGIDVREIAGVVRMAGDTVVIDSLVGTSKGRILVRGGLGVGNFREPSFDLYLVADDAKVMDNDQGEVHVSAGLALRGPFASPYLSGQAIVEHGVIYAPSGPQKRLIGAGDPAIFAVLDTAVMSDRELMPASKTPLLRNLRADLDIAVRRNTWVRSRDVNIEIYTEVPVSAHVENEAIAVTGIVSTDRGEYELMSKRFEVSRGSALFIGSPDLNPTIQLTAQYEVRLPSRPALNVKILVGGTLKRPRITLESDAQPPISQTDLLSFLAFGTESTSLVAIAGSALAAGTAGNPVVSGVGSLATRRLFAVALGLAVDEAESEAGQALGVDVFNIRPADVPDFRGTSALEEFLLGTEFEAGKYITPRTFVAFEGVLPARRTAAPPGLRIEHRAPKGFRYELSYEPRFLLRDPTLSEIQSARKTTVTGVGALGALLIREWRF